MNRLVEVPGDLKDYVYTESVVPKEKARCEPSLNLGGGCTLSGRI